MFPGRSVIGRAHPPFAVHVSDAVVAAPVALTSARGVERTAPAALFQFVWGTAPALSPGAILDVLLPLKSMPIGGRSGSGGATGAGTICSPFTGARLVPPSGAVGAATSVKPVPVML